MKSMYIGSGDCAALLAGKNTKAHANLLRRFVSDEIPRYNAKASPIDAFRTGAILEERYFLTLPDDYYEQVKKVCIDIPVLKSSIDFAKLDDGKIIDFDELKTSNFNDYLIIKEKGFDYVKKKYKANYNQVQFQLLCTGLRSANLVFIPVYEYDDEINKHRDIKENEPIKFRVERDELIQSKIIERSEIFTRIKDYFNV